MCKKEKKVHVRLRERECVCEGEKLCVRACVRGREESVRRRE